MTITNTQTNTLRHRTTTTPHTHVKNEHERTPHTDARQTPQTKLPDVNAQQRAPHHTDNHTLTHTPQNSRITNDCHVGIATNVHQSFFLLCRVQTLFTIFRVLTSHSQDHGRLQVHTSKHSLSLRLHVEHPPTYTHVGLFTGAHRHRLTHTTFTTKNKR